MPRKRKTIEVSALVDQANKFFLNSKKEMRSERRAVQSFLEDVLHKTGNYRGFGYLTAEDLPEGVPPGVIHGNTRNEHGIIIDNTFPDDSRVHFHGGT